MRPLEDHLPLPGPRERIATVSEVRTTLLTSSVRALQTRGDFERYLEHLPREHHETITQMVAAMRIPFPDRRCALPRVRSARLRDEGVRRDGARRRAAHPRDGGLDAREARQGAGVTPWTSFANFGRLWERIFVGGAITVKKAGPKEAIVEVIGIPLVAIPYYHSAQRTLFLSLDRRLLHEGVPADVPRSTTSTSTQYRFAWA